MSEEELLEIIKENLNDMKSSIEMNTWFEINSEQSENFYFAIATVFTIREREIKKLKEENGLLLANNNGYFELKKYVKNNYISKDKIRELIENNEQDIDYSIHDLIEDLKKILEE